MKLNMKLTPKDEQRITRLKEHYGFTRSSSLIRYILTMAVSWDEEGNS